MSAKWMYFAMVVITLSFPLRAYCLIVYEIDGSSTSRAPYDRKYVIDDGGPMEEENRPRRQVREINSSPFASNSSPLPARIKALGEKIIMVDPNEHAWGAYTSTGQLVRWGLATAGANWCGDIDKACRTKTGRFRIYSLGDETCISTKFPVPDGGAPMPYCMYFNGGQALHGSDEVVYGNESHGCVRLHVSDARWLRYKFVEGPNVANKFRGTMVIIKSY